MTVPVINSLVDKFAQQLGDRHFYTIRDLQILGFFGSIHAARKALRNGKLIYVKISPRRRVIPRAALLDYLRNNLSDKS